MTGERAVKRPGRRSPHRCTAVGLVIGEGGSGGALALAVCDRLLIQEHAVFSVLPPEGAAAVLRRDAPELAALLRFTAADLTALGIADEVIPEPGRGVTAARAAVCQALDALAVEHTPSRLSARRHRWRRVAAGSPDPAGPHRL